MDCSVNNIPDKISCSLLDSRVIELASIANNFVTSSPISVLIRGVSNPRSLRPTHPFKLNSFTTDCLIDQQLSFTLTMLTTTTASPFELFASSLVLDQHSSWVLRQSLPFRLLAGDSVSIMVPTSMVVGVEVACKLQLMEVDCMGTGQSI
jgi:hypothetical protein